MSCQGVGGQYTLFIPPRDQNKSDLVSKPSDGAFPNHGCATIWVLVSLRNQSPSWGQRARGDLSQTQRSVTWPLGWLTLGAGSVVTVGLAGAQFALAMQLIFTGLAATF